MLPKPDDKDCNVSYMWFSEAKGWDERTYRSILVYVSVVLNNSQSHDFKSLSVVRTQPLGRILGINH
jgi:hypothetical protein